MMEFLDKTISHHHDKMNMYHTLKTSLQDNDSKIAGFKEYVYFLQDSITKNILDEEFKNFVKDTLKFNFDHTGCLNLDDVYDEYKTWYSKKLFGESPPKSKKEIEELSDLIFKPTMFGRKEPYYKGYYHLSRKHYLVGSYEDELGGDEE
tara:strand:- start:269 stop:715 length:447 start_codon:yes stop_codon:yes gene_type:complete